MKKILAVFCAIVPEIAFVAFWVWFAGWLIFLKAIGLTAVFIAGLVASMWGWDQIRAINKGDR